MILPISKDTLGVSSGINFTHKNIRFWVYLLLGVVSILIFLRYIFKDLFSLESLIQNSDSSLSIEVAGKVFDVTEEEYEKYIVKGEEIPQEKINSGVLNEDIGSVYGLFLNECPENISEEIGDHIYIDFLKEIEDRKVLCLTLGIMTFDTSQFDDNDWGSNSIRGNIENVDLENRTISTFEISYNDFLRKEEVKENNNIRILCDEKQTVVLSGFNHEPLFYDTDLFDHVGVNDYIYLFCSDQGCDVSQDACIVIKEWAPEL